MNRAMDRLGQWLANPNHQTGAAAFGLIWLAGHYALAWVLPNANDGSDLGLVIFMLLTGIAAEKAERLLSWSFAAWFLAGVVLSTLIGAICYSLALN